MDSAQSTPKAGPSTSRMKLLPNLGSTASVASSGNRSYKNALYSEEATDEDYAQVWTDIALCAYISSD